MAKGQRDMKLETRWRDLLRRQAASGLSVRGFCRGEGLGEANFYAWLVCTSSNSKQLKYSANLHVLRYFLYQAYQLKEYPEILAKLDDRVKNDLQQISENWRKLRNEKIDKVASKANDIYLKSNKIEKGIQEYSGVLKFVMDYTEDSEFRKIWNLKP